MLHGEIKVNNIVIGEWKAVRRSHDLRDFNDYDCYLTYRNMAGYPMEAAWVMQGHAHNNGAVSLAARVLMEGMTRLKVKPMERDEEALDLIVRKMRGIG
jgi:hypothetical protein